MSYRGEDLDLRTPGMRGGRDPYPSAETGTNGSLNGAGRRMPAMGPASGPRTESIVVDDTVLACCNHAYDVALAHGSSEVRLEHLVHALTRVEAAAEVLENRGIREAHLRRESAAVIASEIPVGLGHSHAAPRTSAEFEDVLRRASDLGRNRGVGASVHDLLWVLLNYNRDIQAIALLLRHAVDWQQWDWPHQESRRESTRPAYYQEPQRASFVAPPPLPPMPPRPRAFERVEVPAPAPVNASYQTDLEPVCGRLDQMDNSLRRMQADMANDRRLLSDLIRELQRDLASQRNTSGVPSSLVDRLQGVEHTLNDRFQTLERSMTAGLKTVNTSGVNSGLTDLITQQLVDVTEQVRIATDKLQSLERTMETRQADAQRAWSGVGDRLKSLDETINAQRQQTAELKTALGTDLRGTIERAMSTQSQGGGALQSLLNDRFQSINQQFDQQNLSLTSTVAQLTEPLLERMRQVDGASQQRQTEQMQVLRAVGERTTQLETLVRGYGDASARTVQQFSEQVTTSHQRDLTELHDALLKLGANQQTLAENLDQWRAENEGGMSIVSNRIELLERASGQPLQMLKQLQTDMLGLQQVAVADFDQNRKGIRNWLFGTEEPFAGAWRDETSQIRQRLKQLREDRKV